jgi:putative spermidine/putrescine transport system ATP-binding protein
LVVAGQANPLSRAPMSFLAIRQLEKSFGATRVVERFDLDVGKGEFVSLLGPSGCGKTTVLRMIAGFETPSAGEILIEGKDVVETPTRQRNVGMVFQAYALFPNLSVANNVGFGLKIAGAPKAEIAARVEEMLKLIGLSDLAARWPYQLSGGQQQRVALARALAVRPRLLLLDEPLSALDAKIRVSLRHEIRDIQRELGITTIFVTHDQEEALSLSDRVVVMHKGRVAQVGAPHEIYNRPVSRFVANFVGTLNTLTVKVENAAAGVATLGGERFLLPFPVTPDAKGEVELGLRPESIRLGASPGRDVTMHATLQEVSFLGSVIRLRARVGEQSLSLDAFNHADAPPPRIGGETAISFRSADLIPLAD